MTILYFILFFCLGSTCFSFFHLVGSRLPKKKTIRGRSQCESCHKDLRFVDVIPIFGYLINKGKCRHCHHSISVIHITLEVLGGMLYAFSYFLYGFDIELLIILIAISVLYTLSISDIYYKIVLDRVWMIGLALLIFIRLYDSTFLTHLFSSVFMFLLMLLLAILSKKIFKKEALGGGDVKLYLFIGFLLTYQEALLSLFLAALFGLLYGLIRKKQETLEIPLVPFLSLSVLIAFFFGHIIIDYYLQLLGVSNV